MIDLIPQHVSSRLNSSMMEIMRLKGNRFHVWKHGEDGLLLTGFDYILVKGPFARFLKEHCRPDAAFFERKVIQMATHESWPGHTEIVPNKAIAPESIVTEDVLRTSVWAFAREELFISPGLARILKQETWASEFEFRPGFSNFAG